ncbi:hypothetical protein Ndes2526B_g00590 [Nannochloris sp. 'desiccata']|nr:hypothetical protein NADE_003748 [Chlorella desiccata (nom. nud.)]
MANVSGMPMGTLTMALLLLTLTPGASSQNPGLQDKVLKLQGGTNSFAKDPSGLLLPPNDDAARWLNNYYQTGSHKKIPAKVTSSAPPSPTPDREAVDVQAHIKKEEATSELARTSGYLLESEKELIKNLKTFAAAAPTDNSFSSSSSSWWRKMIYKTSTSAITTGDIPSSSTLGRMESLVSSIPELVLKKLKSEADHEAATATATITDGHSDFPNESRSCGGEAYLEDDLDTTDTAVLEALGQQQALQEQESNGGGEGEHRIEPKNQRQGKRRNILVAPVGDDWSASVWMDRPEAATFDIIALYFGDNATYSCPLCAAVVHAKGPKWRLYLDFSNSEKWSTLASQYDYIMLPDDDLHMNTCAINKVFSIMRTYDLIMAQPSVCHARGSATWRPELHQTPQYLLRYTTFVEVMAPTYRMDFYHNVIRATFSKYWTYVGWGLDSVWPALLHYPKDRIAVIDAVCMRHVPSQGGLGTNGKKFSVYAPGLSPYTAKQEELIVFSAFNYSASTTQALGEKFMSSRILGSVPNFYVLEAMAKTAGQKWPSVEFAGEYGVPAEAVEPLLMRDRDAKLAASELERVKNEALLSSQEKYLKNKNNIIRKIAVTSSEGEETVLKAHAWVWVVPVAVLVTAAVRIVLNSSGSSSSSSGGGWVPGKGWRRVKPYDSPLKR